MTNVGKIINVQHKNNGAQDAALWDATKYIRGVPSDLCQT